MINQSLRQLLSTVIQCCVPTGVESVTDLPNQCYACDVNVALVDVATITLTPFMFHFTLNPLMELQVLNFTQVVQ